MVLMARLLKEEFFAAFLTRKHYYLLHSKKTHRIGDRFRYIFTFIQEYSLCLKLQTMNKNFLFSRGRW